MSIRDETVFQILEQGRKTFTQLNSGLELQVNNVLDEPKTAPATDPTTPMSRQYMAAPPIATSSSAAMRSTRPSAGTWMAAWATNQLRMARNISGKLPSTETPNTTRAKVPSAKRSR